MATVQGFDLTVLREGVYTSRALKNNPDINPLDRLPAVLKKDLRRDLCTCNQVLKIDIINAIVGGAKSVDEVKKQTYATMGSGCCKQQVERLIECLGSSETEK